MTTWRQGHGPRERYIRHAPPFMASAVELTIEGWHTWMWRISKCEEGRWSDWAKGYSPSAEIAKQTADKRMEGRA